MTTGPHDFPQPFPQLRCPACGAGLRRSPSSPDDVDRLECTTCESRFAIRFGIPDLRGRDDLDPYLSLEEDLRAADRLHEQAQRGTFEDALASYYRTNEKVNPVQAQRFIAGALAAEDRSRAVLAAWGMPSSTGTPHAHRAIIDTGCGTGPLLVAAGAADAQLLGVDVGLRWLVLAAARIRDRGVKADLVCASASRLPVGDAVADAIISESLYENVPSARAALADAARVLCAGGRLCLTTANRWSIGPDPHVGLPCGSWLPERIVAAWATRRGMVPPRRHLLSARDLAAMLAELPFADVQVAPPPVAEAQLRNASSAIRFAVSGYRTVARSRAGRAVLLGIGPSLLASATKTGTRQASVRPEA